ncbi:MAG: hypothetical protein M5T61_13840 [Acidimicrobiia bacterium]|nr:hypothetical protein [Acidimicrobiia bacterium]
MPTDPFVAPDLDDSPRQQQNLPSGMTYPSFRGRRGPRPGELGPDWPSGSLFGTPGPDVGFGYTLANRAKDRLRVGPHEHASDAVAVVAEIAMRRAALFGRAPVVGDIDLAVTLLGYDGGVDPDLVERRTALVRGADHEYSVRRSVVDSVPEEVLRAPTTDVAARASEWRSAILTRVLDAPPGPEANAVG